ncbi:ABC transporter substrate-binding protein [Massilia sp. TS11]|uniref:substrate-binding periplasmic protein n=1 Tax=Massilia sp. TS11 TaxID=2908003 RepID=UPI001EDA7D83|nr:transporter substrate-binding domain-containing protein [Massilia sp. TS11]MCG2583350.1 transporter substrate-binding domain-containing protein [Massilia sp. TS11]
MRLAPTLTAMLLATAALAPAAQAACSRPLHLNAEHWPPYTIIAGNQIGGLDIELVQAILKEAGCTIVFEPALPVARRLSLFNQGKTDLMMAASSTPERRQQAWFSQPYRFEEVGLFTLPEHAARLRQSFSFEALLAQRESVLVPRLGWYGAQYAAAEPKLRAAGLLHEFSSFSQGIKMLAAGRAHVLMGDDAAVHYQARLENLPVVHLPFTAARAPVHLMFNKESVSQAEVASIDAAITRLERRGTLEAIRRRYGQQ